MNEQNKNPALLPSGFIDLLPPEAEQEAYVVATLMERFGKSGYARVKPPLVEFEDSLFASGPGAVLTEDTFRLMDPMSSKMMGVRSDTTPQIARIASTRMGGAERPLRLMYANDVLRTRGTQKRVERQFCQVGCEIIGRESDQADIEICVISLLGLADLGVQNITIDLTLSHLVDTILAEHKISRTQGAEIKAALSDKDSERLEKYPEPLPEILAGLIRAAGPVDKAIGALKESGFSDDWKDELEKLERVSQGVAKACEDLGLKDVRVTIDPSESRQLEYHQGVSFALFAKGVHGELGRGGRYNIVFGTQEEPESATGFTLYMDTVRKAMAKPEVRDTVFVPAGAPWSQIRKLQDEGWTVLRGTGQNKGRGRCSHEYKDGQVVKI